MVKDDDIIKILVNVLENEELLNYSMNQEINMDSLQFVRLVVDLEEFYNIEFPDSLLIQKKMNSIKKIKQSVSEIIRIYNSDLI